MKRAINPALLIAMLGPVPTANAAGPNTLGATEDRQGSMLGRIRPVVLGRTVEASNEHELDLTLHGAGFTGATSVLVAGYPARNLRLVDDGTLVVTVSQAIAASRDIRVTTPQGESLPLPPAPAAAPKDLWAGVELREDHVPVPSLDESLLDEPFDQDCVILPRELRPVPGRFQPMIQEGETGDVPSLAFLELAPKLALMNVLAYDRGKNLRNGHQLTLAEDLAGWDLVNISAVRGFRFADPNAAFVAHNRALNAICVVFHGSIENSDWITNVASIPVRFDQLPAPDGTPLPLLGRAHAGMLHKYLSCRAQLLAAIRTIQAAKSPEEQRDTQYWLTGHSQGGALCGFAGADLCQALRREHPEFNNARDNRVQVWPLAAPQYLDATAVAFFHGIIGRRNILDQNTWGDAVPNLGVTGNGFQFRSLGLHASQSASEALDRAANAHLRSFLAHVRIGDLQTAAHGAVPHNLSKFITAAMHMATDHNHRGLGTSYAFDDAMVVTSLEGLNVCLQRGFNYRQQALQAAQGKRNATLRAQAEPAVESAPERTFWQRWFGR